MVEVEEAEEVVEVEEAVEVEEVVEVVEVEEVVEVVDAVTIAPDVKESTVSAHKPIRTPFTLSICACIAFKLCLLLAVQLDNDIVVLPPTPAMLEQEVELSILLTRQTYSSDLRDPDSLQFQMLSRQLAEKVSL